MDKLKVGVLGATGVVGQNYIRLLEHHPWFEVSYLAASPDSAGKSYGEAVEGRWNYPTSIPKNIEDIIVQDANDVGSAKDSCDMVFSALDMDKDKMMRLEEEYASHDIPVISNASAHRHTEDIPLIIPEINPGHVDMLYEQQRRRGWSKGFIVVKPNCSLQSYLTPIHALDEAGYKVDRVMVTTMQAVSGAGYPGLASIDMIDNVIPYIKGEEEKTEREPLKILGDVKDGLFVYDDSIRISAQCNRVPVTDGHTASVAIGFSGTKPSLDEVIDIWKDYSSVPQELDLPSAPVNPILYSYEENRPQPAKDRYNGDGMSVTLGRLRKDNILDYKFVGLSHNTIRGAAGGNILNAELLRSKGYLD